MILKGKSINSNKAIMKIRKISIEELERFGLLELIRDKIPQKKDITIRDIARRIIRKDGGILALFIDDQPMGVTLWHNLTNKTAYLWLGAYHNQGKGHGTIVLNHLLSILQLEGIVSVLVKVHKENNVALRHLRKFGFNEIQIRGDGMVILKKRLV